MWKIRSQISQFIGKQKNIKGKNIFNRELHNCGNEGHTEVDCWAKKKEKEDDVEDVFAGVILCGEVSEGRDKEDIEEWLGDSVTSSKTTCTNNNLTDVEELNINITVGNGHKMKRELKGNIKHWFMAHTSYCGTRVI